MSNSPTRLPSNILKDKTECGFKSAAYRLLLDAEPSIIYHHLISPRKALHGFEVLKPNETRHKQRLQVVWRYRDAHSERLALFLSERHENLDGDGSANVAEAFGKRILSDFPIIVGDGGHRGLAWSSGGIPRPGVLLFALLDLNVNWAVTESAKEAARRYVGRLVRPRCLEHVASLGSNTPWCKLYTKPTNSTKKANPKPYRGYHYET